MARSKHRAGRPYRRARDQMFAAYGDVCWICGHGGASRGQADHLTPVSVDPDQPVDYRAMRPVHGNSCRCPTCGRACNQERGARSASEVFTPVIRW